MAKRRARYYVDDVYTPAGRPARLLTLAEARKQLAASVREQRARCKQSYKRCSTVGTVKKGSVQIRIGGKQGYNIWTALTIREA